MTTDTLLDELEGHIAVQVQSQPIASHLLKLIQELRSHMQGWRTPGTIEVCERYDNHDCQFNSHYGASTPSLCGMAACPMKALKEARRAEGGK